MKEKMTIGEYAKLRKVTAETLRHYDRIGLFKPLERDPDTGYRYYSIIQDEKLGTIRELQHLGMSIEEIKAYFDHRNLKQSFALLQKAHQQLQERVKVLQKLERTLADRIDHLDQIMQHTDFETIEIHHIPERLIVHNNTVSSNIHEVSYTSLELEKALNESTPLLASNRLGFLVDDTESNPERGTLFILINADHTADPAYIHRIPAGQYACKIYKGSYQNILAEINTMKQWIAQQGLKSTGPIVEIFLLDISVTDRIENEVVELQIPIIP